MIVNSGGLEVTDDLIKSTSESSIDQDDNQNQVNTFFNNNVAKAGTGALIGGVFGTFVVLRNSCWCNN